ncbi:hypothetical protein U1Q18_013670 [Sarracenia purpurea var. burkii]
MKELSIPLRMYKEQFPNRKHLHPYERSLIELSLGDGDYEQVCIWCLQQKSIQPYAFVRIYRLPLLDLSMEAMYRLPKLQDGVVFRRLGRNQRERKQRHFLAGIGSCSMPSKISTARGGTTHSGAWRRRQAAMVVRRCVTNGAGSSGQRCGTTVDVRQRAMKTAGAWFRQQWRTGTRVASSGWEARYSGGAVVSGA